MQKSMIKRNVGRTALSVTKLGVGGAPFGNMFRAMDTDGVVATVKAAIESGIRYFDTAPSYGFGLSEIKLAVEKSPLGKFARSRKACTEFADAAQQGIQQHRAAMALEFEHMLAGVRSRGREIQQ